MTQVGDLLLLQSLDDELGSLAAAVAGIEGRLGRNDDLEAAKEHRQTAEAQLAAAQREQRTLEASVQDLTARIDPEERRLYSGSVKSPKELQSIQHEVEALKARRAEIEEALLAVLGQVEHCEAELEAAQASHGALAFRWEGEAAELRDDLQRLQALHRQAEERRDEQRGRIPATALSLYDGLRQRRGGVAVVRVQGGACTGCRLMLPDAVRRRATTSGLPVQCPNCERILSAA